MAEGSTQRRFVQGETAISLIAKASELTDAQAEVFSAQFRGQWLQVSGNVVNVSGNEFADTLVSIEFGPFPLGASLYFSRGVQEPLALSKGDRITAQGDIYFASTRGISLSKCEIISVTTAAEQALQDMKRQAQELKKAAEDWAAAPDDANSDREQIVPMGAREISPEKPRLSDAALKLWHQAFLKAYPNGSKDLAEKSAKGAFPNHHISRTRVRELFPNAPRGRPKQINSLGNSPESDGE